MIPPPSPPTEIDCIEQEFYLGLPGCWEIHNIATQYPLYIHQNDSRAGEDRSEDLSWLGRWDVIFGSTSPNFHPCFGWGCQSINLQIFPDESSRTSRNDCATSPCQSCKWSQRPQEIIPDFIQTVTMSWGEVYRILIKYCMISWIPSFCVLSNHT